MTGHNAYHFIPEYFTYSEDFPLLEYFKYSGNIVGKYINIQEDLNLHQNKYSTEYLQEQALNKVHNRLGPTGLGQTLTSCSGTTKYSGANNTRGT